MKTFIALLCATLLCFTTLVHADLNDGLVAYYSFDSCNPLDDSNHGHDGAMLGNMTCYPSDRGIVMRFDGIDDAIVLPTSTLGQWNQLTYSVWVKAKLYSGDRWPSFIGSYTSTISNNTTIGIYQDTGNLHLEVDTNTGDHGMQGALPIPWDTWFHAAMVYDGSMLTEYINGQQGKSMPATGVLNPVNQVMIGLHPGTNYYFSGLLDEVRIYSRALTATEIQEIVQLPPVLDLRSRVETLETKVDTLVRQNASLQQEISSLRQEVRDHSHSYLTGKGAVQNNIKVSTGPATFPAGPEPTPAK